MVKSTHVSEEKKQALKAVEKLVKEYPIVGVVNLENLPSSSLQKMRYKLRGQADIFLAKKRIMKLALEHLKTDKQNVDQLIPHMKGVPALLFSKENPFKLYSLIQKSKSKAAAKPGQKAPFDLKVAAGPTPFAPGPIISELASVGLKTKVVGGKLEILAEAVVAKEGAIISGKLSSILAKLGVEPMEIGLDLTAVYEKGSIYGKDVLSVDEAQYVKNFITAHQWAMNLAVDAGIINKDTVELMVQKASREGKALAIEANILADEVLGEILAKAEAQAAAVQEKTE